MTARRRICEEEEEADDDTEGETAPEGEVPPALRPTLRPIW